ncbi:MAG: hypothetical protein HUU54_08550 [Ignavibacteriaceae bacterium]|nr:hypothetical protein [Ignavibacteriaceae bacterium]
MRDIDWKKIRPLNGSQNTGFEELVCQIAKNENIIGKFMRFAPPDGGIEAAWEPDNKELYGWQAKYFFSLGQSQFGQMEKSFKDALNNYPKLTKYYFCLPINRTSGGGSAGDSQMKKWIEFETKLRRYATKKRRAVEIVYWGAHEIHGRLIATKNKGLVEYWFSKHEYSDDWFKERLTRTIADLGARYSPEINFPLDKTLLFSALTMCEELRKYYLEQKNRVLRMTQKTLDHLGRELSSEGNKLLNEFITDYDSINFSSLGKDSFLKSVERLHLLDMYFSSTLERITTYPEIVANIRSANFSDPIKQDLHKAKYEIQSLIQLLGGFYSSLAISPYLIISGDAGVGKSHLLADFAKSRAEINKPVLFLLGQYFSNNDNIWTQILNNILRINCDEDEFLGALSAKVSNSGERFIIIIDAINESKSQDIWKNNIAGFVKSIEKYPNLGLIISIRTTFKKSILPDSLVKIAKLTSYEFRGFQGKEIEAANFFFRHYKILSPNIPLLIPEFSNPLFLKIYCEGLSSGSQYRTLDYPSSFSEVISTYHNAINERIIDEANLSHSIDYLKKFLNAFLEYYFQKDKLPNFSDACNMLNHIIPNKGSNILNKLVNIGVLRIQRDFSDDSNEIVYFSYERVWDYYRAIYICDEYLRTKNDIATFKKVFIRHENDLYWQQGLLEALSIVVPERLKKELFEFLPEYSAHSTIINSFIESIRWRDMPIISMPIKTFLKSQVFIENQYVHKLFNTIMTIAWRERHSFNGVYIHNILKRHDMPSRDSLWNYYLYHNYYISEGTEFCSIDSIIRWAWSDTDKSKISDESIKLISIILIWFLTSTNRFLRDRASKALISLLSERIHLIKELINIFLDVDDVYIKERFMGIAYGCTLRSSSSEEIIEFAAYIENLVFYSREVLPHILLRDYARGIIEHAISHHQFTPRNNFFKPPYISSFPTRFPFKRAIDKLFKQPGSKDFQKEYYAQNPLIHSMRTESMGGYGDFGRYVLDSAFYYWPDIKTEKMSNWIIKKIFQLGFDVKKHGFFDSSLSNLGRGTQKTERIGKKYQWIAFHELLARTSDNHSIRDGYSGTIQKYEGPWLPYLRDFEPTSLIKSTSKTSKVSKTTHWSTPKFTPNWDGEQAKWIRTKTGFPNCKDLLLVKDDKGDEWFNMFSYNDWEEKTYEETYSTQTPQKYLSMDIRAIIIEKKDVSSILKLFSDNYKMIHEFPTYSTHYEIFLREYYWAPAFKSLAYSDRKIITIDRKRFNCIDTVLNYLWEEEYDCSKDEAISFYIPSKTIFEELCMKHAKKDGYFLNQEDELICFDPSIYENGISSLLIRRSSLEQYLEKNNLTILWKITGEKNILGWSTETKYLGRNEYYGLYYLQNNRIQGKHKTMLSKR